MVFLFCLFCSRDHGSCVVKGKKAMVGSPKAKWSQGKGQTKSDAEDSDGRGIKVLENLAWGQGPPPGARPGRAACTGKVHSWVWSSWDEDQRLEIWGRVCVCVCENYPKPWSLVHEWQEDGDCQAVWDGIFGNRTAVVKIYWSVSIQPSPTDLSSG